MPALRPRLLSFAAFLLSVLLAHSVFAQTFTLTTTAAGNGTGIVYEPQSAGCSTSCSANYAAGTIVQVMAIGHPGSQFTGWGGACSGMCPCFVPMTSNQTVIANFTLNTSAITVVTEGTGTGTISSLPAGLNCPGTCTANLNSNEVVTLIATPGPNSTFVGWTGPCPTSPDPTHCVFIPFGATTVRANFAATAFPVTVVQTGTGAGVTTSSPPGISCPGGACTAMFPVGSIVRIIPTANPGDHTVSISGGPCPSGAASMCEFFVDGPKTITVQIDRNSYSLSIQRQGPGSISVSTFPPGISCTPSAAPQAGCTAFFPFDTLVQVTAIPAPGTIFEGFTGAESSSGNVAFVRTNFYRSLTIHTRCATDFNASGAADVADIFDFLSAWFMGCP